jgi:hypothetical protein
VICITEIPSIQLVSQPHSNIACLSSPVTITDSDRLERAVHYATDSQQQISGYIPVNQTETSPYFTTAIRLYLRPQAPCRVDTGRDPRTSSRCTSRVPTSRHSFAADWLVVRRIAFLPYLRAFLLKCCIKRSGSDCHELFLQCERVAMNQHKACASLKSPLGSLLDSSEFKSLHQLRTAMHHHP